MKRFLSISVLAALAGLLLFSCGKDRGPSGPREIDDNAVDTIHIVKVIPDKTKDSPYARIGFDCGDWSGVEIEYPAFGQQKTDVYQIADTRNKRIYLVTAADKSMTITLFDGSSDNFSWGQQIFSATVDGGIMHCAQLSFQGNDDSGDPTFAVEMVSDAQISASPAAAGIATRGQTEDSIRKSFYDLFDEIGSGWEKLGGYLGGSASEICSMLKEVVIPLGQLNLYADDVDALQKLMKEKQQEVKIEDILVQMIGSDDLSTAKDLYDKVLNAIHMMDDSWYPKDDYLDRLNRVLNLAPKMKKATAQAAKAKAEYKASIKILDKTSESVRVKAEATALVSNPSPLTHTEFHAYLGPREVASWNDWSGANEWSLEHIGGGGNYLICAKMYTDGGLSYNASVAVQMPHYFQVEPAFLKTGVEGGDFSLSITLPDEATWSWQVTEKPNWVTVSGIGKRTLAIKIAPASGERNGDMIIEATDGTDVQTQIVLLVQSGSGWDGTAWSVNPAVNVSKSGRDADRVEYGGGLNHLEFMVIDAASGAFQGAPWNSMRASGKTLVFTYRNTQTAQYDEKGSTYTLTENVTMTVTRTDDTHASVSIRGSGIYSGAAQATCSVSASGTATRIK